jgi:glutamyl-tRNA synthetase
MPLAWRRCILKTLKTTRGRFAPSPTGLLHLGNARTALLAWLWTASERGTFVLRVEDLDRPRCRRELEAGQLEDLAWLGLTWAEGPDAAPPHAERGPHGPYRQSERTALYEEALARLAAQGLTYPCFCSRAEIRAAAQRPQPTEASAPHGDDPGAEGPRYPGTCAQLSRAQQEERARTRQPALRLRVPEGPVAFDDALAGPQRFDPAAEVGDFVVKRADGLFAYQLAVVVDDAAMEITQVLRGRDLLPSTARQLLLYSMLGLAPPRFAHAPLLHGPPGPDGLPRRLSKRDGADTLAGLRSAGTPAEVVVARLASGLGLVEPEVERCTAQSLVEGFGLGKVRE